MTAQTRQEVQEKEEPGYFSSLGFYSFIVIVMWGLVPNLAKAASYPAGFTTFWVNIFSMVGVLVIMAIFGKLDQFKSIQLYTRYALLSLLWPMAYSLVFFYIIDQDSGSMATLVNYMWPLFAILLLSRIVRIPVAGFALVGLGFVSVFVTLLLEGKLTVAFGLLVFGLLVPFTQAFFNVEVKKEVYSKAWLLTFIGALIAVLGSAAWILVFEGGDFLRGSSPDNMVNLAVIGVFANSVGFWAFLKASQLSNTADKAVRFAMYMFVVPFAQVFFLVVGVEPNISPFRFVGIAILAVAFLIFKRWEVGQKADDS